MDGEKEVGYYSEKYFKPEIKRNLAVGAEVAAALAGRFGGVEHVAKEMVKRELFSPLIRTVFLR